MSALENEADTQVPKARVDAGTVDNCLGCARLSCLDCCLIFIPLRMITMNQKLETRN
ncbi:MAG: hypothetical protein QMB41_10925 [Rhodospirillales bacterium]